MTQIAQLTGHRDRVLYLAMSPDGERIVTGAGDETLRFWEVFTKPRSRKVSCLTYLLEEKCISCNIHIFKATLLEIYKNYILLFCFRK